MAFHFQSDTLHLASEILPRRWTRWLAFLGIWTIFGAMSAIHWWFFPPGDYPYTWWQLFWIKIGLWYLLGVLTPVALWLGYQFRIQQPHRFRNLVILFAASLVFTGVYLAGYNLMLLLYLFGGFSAKLWNDMLYFVIKTHSTYYYLAFWSTIAVEHALGFYRRSHQRELHASQLETQLANANLQALRSQIHPHFLFNTLNTISSLVLDGHKTQAYNLIAHLSELLRYSLEHRDVRFITVAEEMAYLDRYLALVSARFSDRLTVDKVVSRNTENALVPTLIMQPVVENAVKHGVGSHGGPGRIEIRVRREDDWLVLMVRNDSPAAERAETDGRGPGIGLSNTRQRLNRLYGDAYSFELNEPSHGKVTVCLKVPFKVATEGDINSERPNKTHYSANRRR
jgi:two-component system LytT family sensor kinase